MQLVAALLGTLGIFLPLTLCEKKDLKKHLNLNKTKQSTDKRWMSSFAQNFIKSQPVQRYSAHYNNDLYSPPTDSGPSEAPNSHYEFNDGNLAPFEDHEDREEHEEQNFQGLKELKVPKPAAPEVNNPNDPAVMFASDIAQYLKPGIGDDPSDMPGGLKSYGGSLNGVGLPITGKLRSTKLTPVASFAEQNMREEMNPHKGVLLSPTTAVIPAVIADSIRSDSSATKLLDEMPGKISEVSASLAESSKAFTGAGETSMIVSSNSDPSPTAGMNVATDNSVTTQIDTNETANNDQPSSTSTADNTSDKSKQDGSAVTTETTETKDAKEGEKTNEAGIANDSDQTVLKAKKPKQLTGHSAKSNDTTKKLSGRRRQSSDADISDASSAKAVEVTSGKDAPIGSDETEKANSTNEDDGDEETEKTPNKVKEKLVSSLREALLENVKEMLNGENSKQLLEEAQAVSDDKPNNVSNTQDDDDGSAESVTLNKDVADSRYIDDAKEDKGSDETGVKEAVGNPQPGSNLLETNLMKIDKKKLVHLLATLMKRYKSNGGSSASDAEPGDTKGKEVEKSSGEKSKDAAADADDKHDDEKVDEETIKALEKEVKLKKLKEEKEREKEKEEGSFPVEKNQMKLNKFKHNEKAESRTAGLSASFFDPYAQIGLTDPKSSGNPAVSNKKVEETPTGRHSVHINLFGDDLSSKGRENFKASDDAFKPSKEFEGKVEAETQRAEEIVNENVERQKARLEAEVQKAHSKEGLENEELMKESKEMLNLAMKPSNNEEEMHKGYKEEKGIEAEKDIGNIKLLENMKIAHMKPLGIEETGLVKTHQELDEKDVGKVMEKTKNLEANESPKHGQVDLIKGSAEREKSDEMKEAENVQAELAKEKEELKMLKEQEKLEKAKEEELKLANAELEEKDKKERASFLEKVKQQQDKDTKQLEAKEGQMNQLKGAKEDETTSKFDKLKGEKVPLTDQLAGKAEFAAEKGEKDMEKVEKEGSQLNFGKVIGEEKEKMLTKEKESENENIREKEKLNSDKIKEMEGQKAEKMKGSEKENAEKGKEYEKQNPEKMKEKEKLDEEKLKEFEKLNREKMKENEKQNSEKIKEGEKQTTEKILENEKQTYEKMKGNEKQSFDKMKENSAAGKAEANEKEKDLKITISAEDEKNKNIDISMGKAKENELKAVESMLEEKEKKVKSMNKEKEEELSRKEKELKEVEKEVELEGKKENKKQNSEDKNEPLSEPKGKEDKETESKLAEKYNSNEKKPLDIEHHRYIHIISPEMVNAITAKVPPHIMESEKEAAKYIEGSFLANKMQKEEEQVKGVSEGKEKAAMVTKEPAEQKAMRSKAAVEDESHKAAVDDKAPVEGVSRGTKEKEAGKDNAEKAKQKTPKTKEQQTKEKNDEFMAIDGPNIETLIEHMEERMRQKKKEKDSSKQESPKFAVPTKDIRKKGRYQQDDAYAQIGSMDPNVKRRKIVKKLKKHIHRHHH